MVFLCAIMMLLLRFALLFLFFLWYLLLLLLLPLPLVLLMRLSCALQLAAFTANTTTVAGACNVTACRILFQGPAIC